MTKSRTVFLLLACCFVLVPASHADSIQLRETGGTGYVDVTFDDTYINVSPADNTTHGNQGADGLQMATESGVATKVALIGIKDLFAVLPKYNGDQEIQIQAADLHLFGYEASADQTVYANRVSTDWMSGSGGDNENDVSGLYAEVSSFTSWSAGSFSQSDWVSTVTCLAAWQPGEDSETVIDITSIIAGMYAWEKNYGLVLRCGEGYATARASEHGMKPTVGITYTYGPGGLTYTLTVDGGSGDGEYTQGLVVDISADQPASGMAFDVWTGDIAYVANVNDPDTTVTMPGMDITVTSTYKVAPICTLTVHSGSGSGQYAQQTIVPIVADPPPGGHVFNVWVGDTAGIADLSAAATTITMPGTDATITATYVVVYPLTVNSGTGSGSYTEGAVVSILADPPASGHSFVEWVGDISAVADVNAAATTVTMPPSAVEVTATYIATPDYTLTVNSGSGSGIYAPGTLVPISADPPPSGLVFNMWAGDPDGFVDWDAAMLSSSTYTMPNRNMTLTATYRPPSSPTDWWPYFNAFCKETFGAEKEPLAYEIFGSYLEFMPAGEWSHVSETSACIAFETNLPANSYIQYGQTTGYGSQTPAGDRYYYLHICHLRGLDPDTEYHYRFVAEDERGNIITSEDKTFTTATPAEVIYVPGGVSGPPYNLDQAGKTYLVTEDLVCDRTAFNVMAHDVTLDLGGHTVIYNQEDYQVTSDYRDTSSMGVRAIGRSNIRVLNGVIKQGLGYNTASDDGSLGYSPAHLSSCSGELAGISIDYAGVQVTGFRLDYSSALVAHHNVILDRGGDVDDRHLSPKAILAAGDCHHNLIKRHRQIAFSAASNSDYYNNEFYVDSCATNGAGIMFYKSTNSSAYGNRIFGTGYLMIGISTVSAGIADVMVHDNFIHLQATRPDDRWPEYGPQSGAYCCRITWGGDNVQYYDNVMATYGRDGGMVRGTWFYATRTIVDCVYRDNILKAVLTTLDSDIQGCIVHVGGNGDPNAAPIFYEGNRLISNFCNARMGEDYYGAGCNAEFYDNTFVRVGPDRPDYRTIGVGYGTFRSTGHKFVDSVFEGGASYDEVRFDGTGERNFTVYWTLTVQTDPVAEVTIKDLNNQEVFNGFADGNGVAMAVLKAYLHEPGGKTMYTPHTVTVAKDGESRAEQVMMDQKKTVVIYLTHHPDPLAITAWHSANDHGGVGEGLLEIPDDGTFSDPRTPGINRLIVTFDKPIVASSFTPDKVLLVGRGSDNQMLDLIGIAISTDTRSGNQGVIMFSPALPDYARYYVRLSDVAGLDDSILTGDADRIMTALVGDASGDLRVNATDLSRVRGARSNPIDIGDVLHVRADISCDGRVNVTDLSRVRSHRPNDASDIDDPDIPGDDFYQEQGGFVEFQAEGCHYNNPGMDHHWQFVTDPQGYLGSGAMQCLPNDGTRYDIDYMANSPRLDYKVNFQTTGTYYIWLRGFGGSADDDSCHVGLDSAEAPMADRISGFAYGEWDHYAWTNYTMSGPPAQVDILYAGEHTINLYMREDGLIVDKFILTTDPTYVATD